MGGVWETAVLAAKAQVYQSLWNLESRLSQQGFGLFIHLLGFVLKQTKSLFLYVKFSIFYFFNQIQIAFKVIH